MRDRFLHKDGKKRLVKAFAEQELVLQNDALAQELADAAEVKDCDEGQQLFTRGQQGQNCLFFILTGSFDLFVRDELVTTMEPGQAVGEFPILDPGLDYTVTIRARERSVVAQVTEKQLESLADDFPSIWRNMAKMLVTRLRKTNELLHNARVAHQTPEAALTPGTLTIDQLIRGLTVGQLWKVGGAIVVVAAAIATVAYNIGSFAGSTAASVETARPRPSPAPPDAEPTTHSLAFAAVDCIPQPVNRKTFQIDGKSAFEGFGQNERSTFLITVANDGESPVSISQLQFVVDKIETPPEGAECIGTMLAISLIDHSGHTIIPVDIPKPGDLLPANWSIEIPAGGRREITIWFRGENSSARDVMLIHGRFRISVGESSVFSSPIVLELHKETQDSA